MAKSTHDNYDYDYNINIDNDSKEGDSISDIADQMKLKILGRIAICPYRCILSEIFYNYLAL